MQRGRMAKILLADDNSALTVMISDVLESEGHTVRVVSNGEAALELAAQFPPDLIITDRKMPRVNGDELARSLRCMDGLSNTPIIMISSFPVGDEIMAALKLSAFVLKPFTDDKLLSAVNSALRS